MVRNDLKATIFSYDDPVPGLIISNPIYNPFANLNDLIGNNMMTWYILDSTLGYFEIECYS